MTAVIPVVEIVPVPQTYRDRIEEQGFRLHQAHKAPDRLAFLASTPGVRAVITNGTTGLKAPEIAALPELEIICVIGAGFEGLDAAAAFDRGIAVSHGPGTNASTVADHAMALLMAVLRDVPALDAAIRQGRWHEVRRPLPILSGKRLGIFGLGRIGHEIARRGQAGFGMTIGYCNRTPLPGCPYEYHATADALAAWADYLVVAAPGGPATRHVIGRSTLAALGPGGYVVNIGRGSVIDADALIDVLRDRRIAGAALDVFENEPGVPAAMTTLPNLVMTPHLAGLSPEALEANYDLLLRNLQSFFAGNGVITPIPRA